MAVGHVDTGVPIPHKNTAVHVEGMKGEPGCCRGLPGLGGYGSVSLLKPQRVGLIFHLLPSTCPPFTYAGACGPAGACLVGEKAEGERAAGREEAEGLGWPQEEVRWGHNPWQSVPEEHGRRADGEGGSLCVFDLAQHHLQAVTWRERVWEGLVTWRHMWSERVTRRQSAQPLSPVPADTELRRVRLGASAWIPAPLEARGTP